MMIHAVRHDTSTVVTRRPLGLESGVSFILHRPIPVLQSRIRTPQPSPQLVQEQLRVVPPQEIRQHILRLPRAPHHIHRLEDSDDVFEEELGILQPTMARRVVGAGVGLGSEKGEHPELPPHKHPGPGYKLLVLEALRCDLAVVGCAVGAHVHRVTVVEVDFLPLTDGAVGGVARAAI